MERRNITDSPMEIYVHIPFCIKKCDYCDFLSGPSDEETKERYIEALLQEIHAVEHTEDYEIVSVFIGGGTPSVLKAEAIASIMETIQKKFCFSPDAEITIESNPGTVDLAKLNAYRETGINRLSLGLQSTDSKELRMLGRIHTYEQFLENYKLAQEVGFKNINVDLMYALKNESLDDLEKDIDKILTLDIKHISCYSLIIEKNTKLYIDNTKYISDDLDSDMYDLIDKKLENKYHRYEVSNYSITSYESRHNLTYWKNNEYYGFGLGAAGYIDNIRYTNTRNLSKYISENYERQEEILTKEDKIKYEFILGLRLTNGINKDNFNKKYGININEIEVIKELINKGLLIDDKINIYVPKKYFYVLNDILVNFV